jgi:hypothetical protein
LLVLQLKVYDAVILILLTGHENMILGCVTVGVMKAQNVVIHTTFYEAFLGIS